MTTPSQATGEITIADNGRRLRVRGADDHAAAILTEAGLHDAVADGHREHYWRHPDQAARRAKAADIAEQLDAAGHRVLLPAYLRPTPDDALTRLPAYTDASADHIDVAVESGSLSPANRHQLLTETRDALALAAQALGEMRSYTRAVTYRLRRLPGFDAELAAVWDKVSDLDTLVLDARDAALDARFDLFDDTPPLVDLTPAPRPVTPTPAAVPPATPAHAGPPARRR
ncbi:hypothetical protein GCM10023205_04270 [Yinghuangia aomiensis]|uniref:Uncharacterized protein n=1 Tax=Yinghuangia aomiensis TaxID=676205 RepID=A0ABP9GQN2_9ACTN